MNVRGCLIALACAAPMLAQNAAPELAYEANANLLKLPDHVYLGEVAGVATNSKGNIFVYTRTGGSFASLGTSRTFTHGGSRFGIQSPGRTSRLKRRCRLT